MSGTPSCGSAWYSRKIKTTAYAPLGALSLETKPLGVKVGVGVSTAAARAGIIGHGAVIAGIPVGGKGVVMNYVTSEADRLMGLIDPIPARRMHRAQRFKFTD